MNLLHEQISALAKELRLPNLPDLCVKYYEEDLRILL